LRERVAANQKDWINVLTDAANEAVADGELGGDTDVATLVFELNALVIAANTAYILTTTRPSSPKPEPPSNA
jgi:hypothetical protein